MQKKTIILLIMLLLLPEFVVAQTLDSYNLDFRIIQNKVLAMYELTFTQSAQTILVLNLPKDSRTISVYLDDEKIEPTIEEEEHSKRVEITLTEETQQLKISYITNQFLEKTKKNFFLVDLTVPYDTKEFQVKLTLPEGAILDKPVEAAVSSVFPKPTAVETDGQRIILIWKKYDVQKGRGFSILVVFREKVNKTIFYFSSALIIILIISISLIFYIKKKKGKKEIVLPHLIETEQAIVNALKKERNNEMWQKQLQIKTGFSKAKLSRVIRNLEQRGIILKTPYGNTNKIKLIWQK